MDYGYGSKMPIPLWLILAAPAIALIAQSACTIIGLIYFIRFPQKSSGKLFFWRLGSPVYGTTDCRAAPEKMWGVRFFG